MARQPQETKSPYREAARTRPQVPRTCLRCDRSFLSAGPHHRLCGHCHELLDAQPTPEEPQPLRAPGQRRSHRP